jgi:hypothetical protein
LSLRALPRGMSLQQWIDWRMPGELRFSVDAAGVHLQREDIRLPGLPSQRAAPSNDHFFDSLPQDDFGPEELELRDVLVAQLPLNPRVSVLVKELLGSPQVKAAKRFLPPGVKVEEWVERRIGGEVLVTTERGQPALKLTPPSKEEKVKQKEEFWETLPADSFTEAETELYAAIMDFLGAQPAGGKVTLSHLGGDKAVAAAKRNCLVDGVSLKEWMERRIAKDVTLEQDRSGQFAIHFHPEGNDDIPQQEEDAPAEMEEDNGGVQDREKDEARAKEDVDRAEKREAWFADLPADSLTGEEADLREAVVAFINQWRGKDPPTLSFAGSDEKIRSARSVLLPRFISLRDWIDSRIGGEIELAFTEGSTEVFFGFRGQLNDADLRRAIDNLKVSKRKQGKGGEKKGGKAKGGGKGKDDRKAFFKGRAGTIPGEPSSKRRRT